MQHGVDWYGQNPKGWLVSEKLDGCRAYWDGKQFWTRSGKVIAAPEAITRSLPPCHLDGEFWAGRGRFTEARVALQYNRWTPRVRFIAFDAPQVPGEWQERIEAARAMGVECVRWWICAGMDQLLRDLERIVAVGGEGLVIRKSRTRLAGYKPGRSSQLQKVKVGIVERIFRAQAKETASCRE